VARYGQAFKDKAVARLLPPESADVAVVSREIGVSVATLERWRADALASGKKNRNGVRFTYLGRNAEVRTPPIASRQLSRCQERGQVHLSSHGKRVTRRTGQVHFSSGNQEINGVRHV